MALIIVLRGINVGGHRRLRPSLIADALGEFDVVNVGAAGTFVARKPGSREAMRAAIRQRLTLAADIVFCESRELVQLDAAGLFGAEEASVDRVRFVSFLPITLRPVPSLPIVIPSTGPWLVRVVAVRGRLAVGEYRRQMKTIGCLGQLDQLFGVRATTRSWSTIEAILRVVNQHE